jgi:hypothetical protein
MKLNHKLVGRLVSLTMLFGSLSAFGQAWVRTSAPVSSWNYWGAIAASADGSRLVASGTPNSYAGYTSPLAASTNFGANWTPINPPFNDGSDIALSTDGTNVVAACQYDRIYVSTNFGTTWTLMSSPVVTAPGYNGSSYPISVTAALPEAWSSVATSADGARIVASTFYWVDGEDPNYPVGIDIRGGVYRSTNSGASWSTVSPGQWDLYNDLSAVACSADGLKLVATDGDGGHVFISSNSGASWTLTSAGNYRWTSVASSADGTKLAACSGAYGNAYPYDPFGYIVVSTNSGATWSAATAPSSYWSSLAWSANGNQLVAAATYNSTDWPGSIYLSSDFGATWTNISSSVVTEWTSVASSADGTKLAALSIYGVYVWSSTVPVAYDQASIQTVLAGTNLTLNAPSDVSGASPFYYQWGFNGSILAGATNTNLTLTNFPLSDSGTYTLLVSNAFGGILLTNAIVTALPAFVVNYTVYPISDRDAQLWGLVTPGPSNTMVWFQWGPDTNYVNSTSAQSAASGFTSAAFSNTISSLTPNTTYHYRPVASNVFGLVTGGDASFTTLYPPPVITNQPGSRVVFAGANVTFSVGADGQGEDVAYQWSSTANLSRVVAGGGTNDPNAGGLATEAEIDNPYILAPDGSGNLFIAADDYNYNTQRIYKVGGDGLISTIVGKNVTYGDGGAATNAILSDPQGMAADAYGNLFVADGDHSLVRKVDTNGIITTGAGNGTFGFSGDGGAATNASLNYPMSVALDSVGNLYIADYDNQLVRKVDAAGVITTVAGNGTNGSGSGTYSGDGGAATNAGLNGPDAVAVDTLGNLYIADTGNQRIRKVDATGVISTVAGNGTSGFSGDGGRATNASLALNNCGIALDSAGNLFIADFSNYRIRKVNTNGIISTVAGNGTNGYSGDGGLATNAEFGNPNDVAVDAAGNLYIADYYNSAVRKVDSSGVITTVAAGLGAFRVVTDHAGNLFVSDFDTSTVLRLGTNGLITAFAGGGIGVPEGGPAANAQFYASGLAADGHGSLFVSDRGHGCVRKVSADGAISTFVGNVGWPAGIAFDTLNNLLIADQASGSILRVGTNGSFTPLAALPGNPSEIATDAAGDVFAFLPNAIINNYSRGAVWRIALDGTVTGILNAGILIPPPSPWGGWSVTASFRHMTADQYGNVFVSYYAYYSGGGQCYECDFGQAGILENGGNLIGPAKWGGFGALATDSANALYYVSGPFVVKQTDTQHSVLTLSSVSTNDAGDYQVTIWGASANSVTSALVSLTVATSPEIYNTIRNSEGSLALSCVSPPGSTNLVQVATNLAPPVLWQTLSTNIAGPDGDWQFTDTNTANSPARFYRTVTLGGQ